MGTDNLHHRRKAKTEREQQRQSPRRKPYDRVLIVCEGEKTEPIYLQELCDYYQLSTANVKVDGKCGSSPKSIYEHAVDLHKHAVKQGNAYDRVYCVFDKDTHNTYQATLDKIAWQKPNNTFFAITSVPCFEYWLLLHFYLTTKPYAACGNNSIADQVIKDLKQQEIMSTYQKSAKGLFQKLLPRLETAKQNARQSLETANREGIDNPSTRVHELVDYLQNLKK